MRVFSFFLCFLVIGGMSADDFQTIRKNAYIEPRPPIFDDHDMIKPCAAIIGLKHRESGGVGYSNGYTTAEAMFFPVRNSKRATSFLDLRYHILNSDKQAFNVGVGCRYSPVAMKYAFGVNIYYDFREKNYDFHQIGVGLEVLGRRWDIRANGYFSICDWHVLQRCYFDDYIGDYFFSCKRIESALTGFDFEIGRLLNKPSSDINIYSAVGTYYYGGKRVCRKPLGVRARLNMNFYRFLMFEGIFTYDSVFRAKVQGVVKITIPFGCRTDKKYKDVLSKHVNRQEIIVLSKFCKWDWNW